MSTRAIIAYTRGDGRWIGVWNHWSGHTQYLGAEIVRRVELLHGDLDDFCRRWIDGCPEGWSDFENGKRRSAGRDVWTGAFVDARATFAVSSPPGMDMGDNLGLPDAHYLYLLDLTARRLLVFEVDSGPRRAFTECRFDENGVADRALAPVAE